MIIQTAFRALVLSALAALALASAAAAGPVVAKMNCRSFGQTAASGGALNIKYATPVMCWATGSTVNGVPVNENGWVPEVFFDWDWNDTSLGSVTRGGVNVPLGKSVGLVAAHAFKPTTYGQACGGGTNSLHTVSLRVSAVVSGQRVSDTTTLSVCVENPSTTWPTPVAFCNDSNCADDGFANVVNPGTPVHGGNLTDLATILSYCATNGSERILVEGGVTFSTGSLVTVGSQSCLVESYGTGKAKLRFTNTSTSRHAITSNGCGGYRISEVTLAGSGASPKMLTAGANTGCIALIESDVSQVAGEEFYDFSVIDPTGDVEASEVYWIKTQLNRTVSGIGTTSMYVRCKYCAWVGGELSASRSHTMRLPQWDYVVLDAMKMSNVEQAHTADHLLTWRQNCGGSGSPGEVCPLDNHAGIGAITRNEFLANDTATVPMHFCTSGAGGAQENTKCFDVDIIWNTMRWDGVTGSDQFVFLTNGGGADSVVKRFRFIGNALDMSAQDSSNSRLATLGATDEMAFIGNAVVSQGAVGSARQIANGGTTIDVAKNNVCWENGTGTCNLFPSVSEGADNVAIEGPTDPFDATAAAPATFTAFKLTDLRITSASPLSNKGVVDPMPIDIEGNVRSATTPEPGPLEASGNIAPPPPPPGGGGTPTTAPAAPVLL